MLNVHNKGAGPHSPEGEPAPGTIWQVNVCRKEQTNNDEIVLEKMEDF